MNNYSKYDAILAGIALTIIVMLTGVFVTPTMTISAGVVGAALTGIALFAISPTAETERFK